MLSVGQRVRLAADLRLAGTVTPAAEPPEETGAFAASVALAAGIEGASPSHQETKDTAADASDKFKRLIRAFVAELPHV